MMSSISLNIWQMSSKTSTQKKKLGRVIIKIIWKAVESDCDDEIQPNPASAKITGDSNQTFSCKERGNSSLHLPSPHEELLHEVEGFHKTGQELKYLYRSTGICTHQKSTNTVQ